MKNSDEFKAMIAKVQYKYIATSNKSGRVQIDTVEFIEMIKNDRIILKDWFCDGTIINLSENKYCNILVWDQKADSGLQLFGKAEKNAGFGLPGRMCAR